MGQGQVYTSVQGAAGWLGRARFILLSRLQLADGTGPGLYLCPGSSWLVGEGRVYTAGSILLSREQLAGGTGLGLYCCPGSSWLVGR
jgi:hypothetical protein